MATTIFSKTLTASDGHWQGDTCRLLILSPDITAVSGSSISVTIVLSATTSSGTISAAYIGQQGTGNAWNFDGNQSQLKFSGATSVSGITGLTTLTSDFVPFVYTAGNALVVSLDLAGTLLDSGSVTGQTNENTYFAAGTAASLTAPSGFSVETGICDFVSLIQVIPTDITLLGQECY